MNKLSRLSLFALIAAGSLLLSLQAHTEEQVATLRKGTELNKENPKPAPLQNPSNKDIKRARSYPMQPPTIPHKTDNYQTNLNANKCLSCHSRSRVEESQAPMISVTHFMNRDGNFLADVSPRRYFCKQCHVTQVERKALVKNDFKDVNEMLKKDRKAH
ncbi:MAG: periplasmic nitrate reductase electron transfer subunit [Alteromonadaceae bacterium]|nr:MAG: periplasmic nitrate reductase electron transfer subunit [Alteromonadaceae bacterium]